MAKPLSALTLSALALPTQDLTAVQIYNLSVQGLIEPEGDLLVHSKKAGRATARMAKQAELETVKVQVFGALKELGKDSEMMFRLDDVLKVTGLDKTEYRGLILESLRAFREEGLTESVKLSDNNFQIFWKVTPEFLQS
jgi:hypothetical protein|tara:strand:+ start:278 stop:694 length:417 start_codon:yes stop_codon:yes gene_type:complete